MRPNRLAWLAGAGLAVAAAARAARSRRRAPAPTVDPDPRADELRQKLAEARDLAGERDEFEAAETPIDHAEAPGAVDDRRREIHERGRAVAEEMRGET